VAHPLDMSPPINLCYPSYEVTEQDSCSLDWRRVSAYVATSYDSVHLGRYKSGNSIFVLF
jgi:hypothetical protein